MGKILIVDDEKSIRFSFGSILTDAGYSVEKAEQFLDAKAIITSNQIDVAIVDRLLGSENGLDLVEYINKVQPFCKLIMISAFPSFQSAAEGIRHGLFAYLKKPIRKKELCSIVEAAITDNNK